MTIIRNSKFGKTISVFLAIAVLNVFVVGCDELNLTGESNESENVNIEYTNDAQQFEPDNEGEATIESTLVSEGEEYDLTYEIQVEDEYGDPLSNVDITYNQINEKSIIYLNDDNGDYTSALLIATPQELESYKSGDFNVLSYKETRSENGEKIIGLTIGLIVTMAAITTAQIGIIMNAYKIQEFYLTDYVTETEDYILYCKTFEEIAQLIKSRIGITTDVASIFVSYASAATGPATTAIKLLGEDVPNYAVEHIRDELIEHALNRWSTTLDEVVGRKVAVKVYPYEEDNSFSNARNLFATYQIEIDNPSCNIDDGVISGRVTDAANNQPLQNCTVRLSGEDYSTELTNEQGEYSFYSLSEGNYSIEVEKDGYISEEKSIDFDGTVSNVNFVLSEALAFDEYRVVLTWNEYPEDMDLHLLAEDGTHIYWSNQGSLYQYPYIYLDVDDMESYGPETITISELQNSSIFVHNYTDENYGGVDITSSGAAIKVYRGNESIASYEVPSSGDGFWWHVFDIESDGNIITQNYIFNIEKQFQVHEKH